MAAAVAVTVLAVGRRGPGQARPGARDLAADARWCRSTGALSRSGTISRSAERELARARTSLRPWTEGRRRSRSTPPASRSRSSRCRTPGDPFTFQVGTLNVLGSQHTRGSRRYGPGTVRTGRAAGDVPLARHRPAGAAGGAGRPAERALRPARRLRHLARTRAGQQRRTPPDRLSHRPLRARRHRLHHHPFRLPDPADPLRAAARPRDRRGVLGGHDPQLAAHPGGRPRLRDRRRDRTLQPAARPPVAR